MRLRRLRDERGQTSLFMALFISTMILLFAFTTNIGMLVHAKINLQNAADAAAYAGAAVQARQLTAVGYLNYEMRRAVKEFLFYYTVRGQSAGLQCYPFDANGANPLPTCPPADPEARWHFQIFDRRESVNETNGDFLPTVCVIFDKNNNYCQKKGVAGIPEFPSGGGWGVADPIVAQVRNATNQIIDKKLADCLSRTGINQQFLIAWLFNLYPIQDSLSLLRTGQDSDDPFPFSNGLERIGILPRMAILRARIDNYEEMLNLNLAAEGASLTIEDSSINAYRGMMNATKPLDYFERPLQAYLSAKNNLVSIGDNGIFADLQVTELLPTEAGSGDHNPNLKNKPTLARFKDLYSRVAVANSKFETLASGGDRGNCRQYREVRVINHFPFGVTKDPSILTYYAVRVQAKARLLFSPFSSNGTVTLSAYSAAKPFGSRVGKDLSQDPDHLMTAPGQLEQDQFFGDFRFPNLLVADNDTDTQLAGFTRMSHLGYIRGAMAYTNRLDVGARLAGAYAPWEVGYYTVPANFKQPDDIGLFEDNPIYNGKYFALAAPLMPINGGSGSGLSFLRNRVGQYLEADITDSDTVSRGPFAEFLNAVLDDNKWAVLDGFMGESQKKFHFIPDPLLNDEPDLLAYVRGAGGRFTVAALPQAQRRQLTSWNNQKTALDNDPDLGIPANSELGLDIGRSGYSVRFVSFKTLQGGGRATNDPNQISAQWSNPFARLSAGDSAARISDDLKKIKH